MRKNQSSKTSRQDFRLLRNDFKTAGRWGMPIIKKCEVNVTDLLLVGSDKIRKNDNSINIMKAVHFFVRITK